MRATLDTDPRQPQEAPPGDDPDGEAAGGDAPQDPEFLAWLEELL